MPEPQEQPSNWLEEAAQQPEQKEAPKPEVVEESETPEPQAKEKVEKVVPLAALHEERAKRREAIAREQALSQQVEQLRRQQLEWMAKQQPQTQAPDIAADPVGALVHSQTQTANEVQALRRTQWENEQRAAQQAQVQNFVSTVRAQNDEFVKQQPDANDAINFLKSNRVEEYKAMGMSQQEAQGRMLHDEMQLAQWALQNGENPAAVAYRMAEQRGYVAPAKKLDMQAQGQKASMPSGSGKTGGMPSLEALLKMDSKEFEKATSGDNWAKLMKKHGA